jgi:hypothetical protein
MKKIVFYFAIGLIVLFVCKNINHQIRKFSQNHKTIYEVVMVSDLVSFALNGGGAFEYQNYYKWSYAKWRIDPKRTTFQKIMFWDVGLLYDASNPPKEYVRIHYWQRI